jgi:hypothetical protein
MSKIITHCWHTLHPLYGEGAMQIEAHVDRVLKIHGLLTAQGYEIRPVDPLDYEALCERIEAEMDAAGGEEKTHAAEAVEGMR